MNITEFIASFADCPCGRAHGVKIKAVEIGRGLKTACADILRANGFPKNIILVADTNTLAASDGIYDILVSGGFSVKLRVYDSFRTPTAGYIDEIVSESDGCDGILSVGTGSLNDICRRAAYLLGCDFAIFATAPSMDGFASSTSPIIENNIKSTLPARAPSVIIADTDILSAAPAELKSAGFGDIIGKFTALTDWRISHILTGEYYCEAVAELVRSALKKVCNMADKVMLNDPEAAGALMETLVLTGLAMTLTESSRPASGAEHMVSHLWGMKKLEQGLTADYHGKKVGVATLALTKLYHDLADSENLNFHTDTTEWNEVYAAFGPAFAGLVTRENTPTITDGIEPLALAGHRQEIRKIINEELPPTEFVASLLRRAGAATTYEEIGLDLDEYRLGMKFHPYMRHKVVLTRLIPMTDFKPEY